jgi:hypothetical protein
VGLRLHVVLLLRAAPGGAVIAAGESWGPLQPVRHARAGRGAPRPRGGLAPQLTLYLLGTTAHLALALIAVMTADISAFSSSASRPGPGARPSSDSMAGAFALPSAPHGMFVG